MWNLFLQCPLQFLVMSLIFYVVAILIAYVEVSNQINTMYSKGLNPGPNIPNSMELIRQHMKFWGKAIATLEVLTIIALFLFF